MLKEKVDYILSIFRTPEIRRKLLFSVVIIIVFRLLATIPVVGIPANAIKDLFKGSEFGDLLSTLSGGVLETASVVAIGLSPYINASVILQLLTTVIPKLEELRKEGSQGRKTISMYTRFLTIPLAVLQSFVMYATLHGTLNQATGLPLVPELSGISLIAMSLTFAAGSVLMMWMGELISESGVGGGSSWLIFLGIISSVPGALTTNFRVMDNYQKILFVVIYLAITASVIYIMEAERKVKVQYSRRVRAGGSMDSFIPLKLTQFGVMPVIFASSLFTFPDLIAQFIVKRQTSGNLYDAAQKVIQALSNPYVKNFGLFALIIAFSFFYVTVVFNTDEMAENLQKQGAFIPGIRPGKATSKFLRVASFRLTAVGAVFLAFLAILPNLLLSAGLEQRSIISGTGFLIVIGTVLEVKRQIESMVVVRSYNKYL